MSQSSETFVPVPAAIERWSLANALATLLGASLSAAYADLQPAIAVAIVSITWCWWRYAPRASSGGVGMANLVTASRLGLFAGVLFAIPHDYVTVASTATLVYVFDGVDGWIARKRGEVSSFGATFDMETDSQIMLLLSVYLVVDRNFGLWVLTFGALRYVYVLARAVGAKRGLPVRERRSNWGRWVYTFAVTALTAACIPAWALATVPLLAACLILLTANFVPDFAVLIPRSRKTSPT